MYIQTNAACGSEVRGWILELDSERKIIYLDSNFPITDKRESKENVAIESSMCLDSSMVMDVDAANEVVSIHWHTCSQIYEWLLPFPIDADRKYNWNAKPKIPAEIAFTGHGSGYKPGMDPGPYDPA